MLVLVVVAHRKCFGATSHGIAAVAMGVVLHLTSDFPGTATWMRPSDVHAHTSQSEQQTEQRHTLVIATGIFITGTGITANTIVATTIWTGSSWPRS